MKILYDEKPIIALSSGTSNSALAIVRISSSNSLNIFKDFFSTDISLLKPNVAKFCNLLSPSTGEVIDEIILTFFKGPNSYNGENIFELSLHGNLIHVENVLKMFVESSLCRPAEAGEFTYRAFKNQKLTLSQVEGLDLLLNANSNFMVSSGISSLRGDLYRQYKDLYDSFVDLRSSVELSIDFLEDIGDEQSELLLKNNFSKFNNIISTLFSRTKANINDLLNPSIAFVGQTNAGKSSIFNTLLNSDRSIVSNIAGTTRDFVSEYIYINGTNFRIVDTAGIRLSGDTIESIGIERAKRVVEDSFFKILVVNPFETDLSEISSLSVGIDLVVYTHLDCDGFFESIVPIQKVIGTDIDSLYVSLNDNLSICGPIEPTSDSGPIEPKFVSGPIEPDYSIGPIEPVISFLSTKVSSKYENLNDNSPISVARQREMIASIHDKVRAFEPLLQSETDIAIISSELNLIGSEITNLIGIITSDDILSSIFSNFCIGK